MLLSPRPTGMLPAPSRLFTGLHERGAPLRWPLLFYGAAAWHCAASRGALFGGLRRKVCIRVRPNDRHPADPHKLDLTGLRKVVDRASAATDLLCPCEYPPAGARGDSRRRGGRFHFRSPSLDEDEHSNTHST